MNIQNNPILVTLTSEVLTAIMLVLLKSVKWHAAHTEFQENWCL